MIRITLRIKSRAFGVTFGTFSKTFEVELGIASFIPPFSQVLMDERGVYLKVEA